MKRFTKRCDFNDILNCQNLIDGAEEDCEYRTERGYCANPRLYFSGKELDNFEEKYDFEIPTDALLAATMIEQLGDYEQKEKQLKIGCELCRGFGFWEFGLYQMTFKTEDGNPVLIDDENNIMWDLSEIFQFCPKCGKKLVK